jgi:hypothetical protein
LRAIQGLARSGKKYGVLRRFHGASRASLIIKTTTNVSRIKVTLLVAHLDIRKVACNYPLISLIRTWYRRCKFTRLHNEQLLMFRPLALLLQPLFEWKAARVLLKRGLDERSQVSPTSLLKLMALGELNCAKLSNAWTGKTPLIASFGAFHATTLELYRHHRYAWGCVGQSIVDIPLSADPELHRKLSMC